MQKPKMTTQLATRKDAAGLPPILAGNPVSPLLIIVHRVLGGKRRLLASGGSWRRRVGSPAIFQHGGSSVGGSSVLAGCYARGMVIKPGRKIALAVKREWYTAIAKHKFLKEPSSADHRTDLFTATIEDLESPEGIWVRPNERFSDFSLASLFVPWNAIVAAMLLGPDDEKRLGFV
jgi:hypothetical protein